MASKRVLFVDDNADTRAIFEVMCQLRSYEVDCATSMASAEKLWDSENRYDMVVTDLDMPGVSGYVLCRWMRDRNAKIPIFLYTAMPEVMDLQVCGATACFFKTFGFEPLFSAIESALQ